jgi:hypothetical protein
MQIADDNPARFHVTRQFDNGRTVSACLSGHANVDDVIDFFRGFMVQMGYSAETAARLDLIDEADEQSPST